MEKYTDYYTQHQSKILDKYFEYLKYPSIATDSQYKKQVLECADFVNRFLSDIGFSVELWEQEDHAPAVFATKEVDPSKPTLLLYGHYDVQPVDPLDLWESPPFEPTIRDDKVYARGAVDNKGQGFYMLSALKAFHDLKLPYSCNLKVLIEGEEESGSSGLYKMIQEHQEKLKTNYFLIVDSGFQSEKHPKITLGARGMVALDVICRVAKTDMHSGLCGGMVLNPNHVVADLISQLHNGDHKVSVPGFYDEVMEMRSEEKNLFDLSFDTAQLEEDVGAQPLAIERGVSPGESITLRPTLEINGIAGGYAGEGLKTVIPKEARFKISCRLVPQQHPGRIGHLIREFLIKKVPKGVEIIIDQHSGEGAGFRSSPQNKAAQVMQQAYETIYGIPCTFGLIGGSIPIAPTLGAACQSEPVLVGLSLPSDQIHAPNEHFSLDRFEKGFLSICYCLEHLGL